MLKRLSPAERAAQALAVYGDAIKAAFLAAIADIRSKVVLSLVVTRLEKGDIGGAIEALKIEGAAFNAMLDEIAKAFNGGGGDTIDDLPLLRGPEGFRIVLRFNARDPVAEAWLRDYSAGLVTAIVDDQRQAIRVALQEAQTQGVGPRAAALDIVGRKNPVTGKREGGVLGLTAQQERFVANARAELSSGDPAALQNYLARARRDRRFDKTIQKAIAAGKPLPADSVTKIAGRYSDGLLKLRGEMIGRTETLAAQSAGSEEAMRQTIASGAVSASMVTAKWHTIIDGRERRTHEIMNGQTRPWGEPFVSASGARLRWPGDPQAPASEIVGCRCTRTYSIRRNA